MGIVASKGDNSTPLLNLCKERRELIRAARDARYHLARSHLLYFKTLLNFSNALNQFVHKELIVISYSSDDDSSSCDLICSGSDSDSDSVSDSECLVCDRSDSDSQTVPLSSNDDDRNQQKPESGDGTCGSSNSVQEGMETPREGLGFFEREFVSAPSKDEMRGSQNFSSIKQDGFTGHDIFGLYDCVDNTQCVFMEPDQRDDQTESDGLSEIREREGRDDQFESDGLRESREREGIPELEPESDHNGLIRKNQKKKKKKIVEESSSVSSDIDKRDIEANMSNGQVAGEADKSNQTCAQETQKTPEIDTKEVLRSNEETCDEAHESSSSSFSELPGSGLTDLRNIVEKIKCICEKAASYSEVSELLEVSRIVYHQPLGFQFKEFASRVLGCSGNPGNSLPKRSLRADDIAGSLSMALEKLYMWEKKLYAEVTDEEKLRVSYDKAYKTLKSLDEKGAEASEIYEAEIVVKLQLSKVNVSVRAVESISMRIHKIRDEELLVQVIEIINGFKKMWSFLAKCHHRQCQAIARSKSCVHIVEKGSSSRKATQQVEEQIRRYRESLRGYIEAQRSFVKFLNEWLRRNIMEDDETEIETPEIFRVCSEWLREIENVDGIKVLSAVEELRMRFRGIGLKQVEEEKQRMRIERLCKELERKTKELEEILGTTVVFPASDSGSTANMIVGPELLSLRESVAQEREKHERVIRELNDAVSMSLQECLVPVFEALEDFCFANFKAYENIRIVSRGALFLCQS